MNQNTRLQTGQDGTHLSFCRLCEALCGLTVEVEAGRVTRIGPDREHPVSEGHLCVKAARMADLVHDPDRVLHPLRRIGGSGEFEQVSWGEALGDIAARLGAIVDAHGSDSIASYLGNPASFATMHPAYLNGFLAALSGGKGGGKKFNSLHADTAAKNLAAELTYGNPYRYTFPDLEHCDFLLIIGGNPAVSHMSLISEPRVLQRLDAIAEREGVVVIDPRLTETGRRYEHLPVRPDSDVWLIAMLLRTVFDEDLFDPAALEERTAGWRELRAALQAIPFDTASAQCGVPVEAARALARRFARARTAACYTRLGTGRGTFSTLTNLLIEALNIVTGRLGESGGWVMGQGAVDIFRANPNPYGSKRSRVGDLPLLLGISPGGSLAEEITTPGEGQVRALFVDSGNPVLSYPRGDRLESALDQLELMVSLDIYVTETTRWSDYILPATTFLEREDMNELWGANAPRPWIQYSDAVLRPQGESRNEFDVYAEILQRMGLRSPLAALGSDASPDPGPIEAADRLLRSGKWGDQSVADGLSVARLQREFPHGYRFLHNVDAAATHGLIGYEDKRPRLWGEVHTGEFERLMASPAQATPDFPLKLFGRRRLQSLNSWMHNSQRLTRNYQPTLQLHPEDASRHGIASGDTVRLASADNEVMVEAQVTEEVIPGSVSYPHGWGHRGGWQRANSLAGANVNLLASDRAEDWEQVSGICLMDGIPVRIEAVVAE